MLQDSHQRLRHTFLLCGSVLTLCALLSAGRGSTASPTPCLEQVVGAEWVRIDWPTAAHDAQGLLSDLTASATSDLFTPQHNARAGQRLQSFTVKEGMLPLAHLGEAMAAIYPGVSAVPVPVLAPVNTAKFLTDAINAGQDEQQARQASLAASVETIQFLPGISGFDALLTVSAKVLADLDVAVVYRPQVHIAGTALSYGGDNRGDPVPELQDLYPDVRSLLGADEVTYTFRKYGVLYFANLGCLRNSRQPGTLTCEQAGAIVRVMLRDLRLIGGGPLEIKQRAAAVVPRPGKVSATFKYHPPGKLLKGTSQGGGEEGDTSCKLHSAGYLGFPIRLQPVYANSQVFMHSGDCQTQKEDVGDRPDDKFDRYRCTQNGSKELLDLEGHAENYAYPWRDNYCEARLGAPANSAPGCSNQTKSGHAGQDLRPNRCIPARKKGARCRIDAFEVVAVADGKAWWKTEPYENHMRLMMDGGTDKIYFMYLHMSPGALWNAGMERGRAIAVKKDQVIGLVGNFDKTLVGGTSTHLHFEIRHGDNVGPPVSPYWTLVRAYELRIKARGKEITD